MNNITNERRSLITTNNAPTRYLSAMWDLRAIHTSKHGLEKEELTQQGAWLVKNKRKEDNYFSMNLCGKLSNNFLH